MLECAHPARISTITDAVEPNHYGRRENSPQKNCKNARCAGTPLPSMRGRCARKALFRELVEIVPPIFIAILTEFKKILPTKDSGRVHVVESQPHGVIADLVHFENLHRFLAANGAPLARRMALDLGARAAHAQIFGGKIKTLAAVEGDGQRLAILVQPQDR